MAGIGLDAVKTVRGRAIGRGATVTRPRSASVMTATAWTSSSRLTLLLLLLLLLLLGSFELGPLVRCLYDLSRVSQNLVVCDVGAERADTLASLSHLQQCSSSVMMMSGFGNLLECVLDLCTKGLLWLGSMDAVDLSMSILSRLFNALSHCCGSRVIDISMILVQVEVMLGWLVIRGHRGVVGKPRTAQR